MGLAELFIFEQLSSDRVLLVVLHIGSLTVFKVADYIWHMAVTSRFGTTLSSAKASTNNLDIDQHR